jgi:hypothetical protein
MRTSAPSPTEIAAFNKFAFDYDIIIDGEIGVKNADPSAGPSSIVSPTPTLHPRRWQLHS